MPRILLLKAAALIFLAAISACSTIPASEFQEFRAQPHVQRANKRMLIRWEVREDASSFCLEATAKAMPPGREPLACAIWQPATNSCLIVTKPNTTHTALGHELRHCFEGHFHD